jgi:hypothetical protein
MNARRVLIAVTALNLALFAFSLYQSTVAQAQGVAPVLRGRALEIVDERGRVRASIQVFPEDPKTKYPETVLLRLSTSQGAPNVKLAATEIGAAQVLGGESDPTHIQLLAERGATSITLKNKDAREYVIRP